MLKLNDALLLSLLLPTMSLCGICLLLATQVIVALGFELDDRQVKVTVLPSWIGSETPDILTLVGGTATQNDDYQHEIITIGIIGITKDYCKVR